jgi:hypothetical protein
MQRNCRKKRKTNPLDLEKHFQWSTELLNLTQVLEAQQAGWKKKSNFPSKKGFKGRIKGESKESLQRNIISQERLKGSQGRIKEELRKSSKKNHSQERLQGKNQGRIRGSFQRKIISQRKKSKEVFKERIRDESKEGFKGRNNSDMDVLKEEAKEVFKEKSFPKKGTSKTLRPPPNISRSTHPQGSPQFQQEIPTPKWKEQRPKISLQI